MKLLLDTHTFLWADTSPDKLSKPAAEAFQAPSNEVFLSIVSIWEMQIKAQLGRLKLRLQLPELVRVQQEINGLHLLSIELDHIYGLDKLPLHHRDPFDRILIAQAQSEDLTLLTDDGEFPDYDVKLLW